VPFFLLSTYLILNLRVVFRFLLESVRSQPEDKEKQNNASIQHYHVVLEKKSTKELLQVLKEEENYQDSYVEAARRILQNRNII
jgi:uncharacterized membrane protein